MPLKDPETRKAYDRERHRQRVAKGFCINCAKVPIVPPQQACEACRAKQRAAQRRLARQRQLAGVCNRCGERRPIPGCKRCEQCNAHWMQGYKKHHGYRPGRAIRRQTLKRIVMEAYGGTRCVCCGETGIAFLTIDHIEGKGRQHRKAIERRGETFYRWLKLKNFPRGYRVMCMNCNCSLAWFRYCPHQLGRRPHA